ncbi:unnamed protein product [Didymodactylos carnosus]|uniref:Uncharacterized protein n=1 Tax=Didymodactylos carnosus TaxID=1234261 RepID=A0A8S2UXV1_9BILA|nr:unnamed protein product [Didymodactylos carnosus]CAF4360822.1 unnamed protein product [Didymodactylos carnosus]
MFDVYVESGEFADELRKNISLTLFAFSYLLLPSPLNALRTLLATSINISLIKILQHYRTIELSARSLVENWLKYNDKNNILSHLSYHAALLLAQSNIWNAIIANILCDLLICDNDYFHQHTETILNFEDIKLTTNLTFDTILIFIKHSIQYRTQSASA